MDRQPMPENTEAIHPRKLEIVEAAVTCFLEKGYHQTGVRDIVGQVGISLGNLYNHFKSKEAILIFIAEIEGQELSDFINELTNTTDPHTTLRWFVKDYAAYVARPENALLGVEILTEALRNETISAVFGRNRGRLIDSVESCLILGGKTGVFRAQSNPRVVACLILDALEGQGLRGLSAPSGDTTAAAVIEDFILNGLAP